MVRQKPLFMWRLLLVVAIAVFASIENNPLVKLEAALGLSPSPIEIIFGIKSLFSGMTEGVFQFSRMNFESSVKANIFAPLVIPLAAYSILTWNFPKVDTKKKECVFFSVFIALSIIVNVVFSGNNNLVGLNGVCNDFCVTAWVKCNPPSGLRTQS